MDKYKTHYEVLGVHESCTHDEIRLAFLEKSKKHHPDKNLKSLKKDYAFVAINEAYSTLGKANSRSLYDTELANGRLKYVTNVHYYSSGIITNAEKGRVIFRDSSLYENRDRSQDSKFQENSYYGIKGVKRLSNGAIAAGVVLFMVSGAAVQYVLSRATAAYALKQMDGRVELVGKTYADIKEQARVNGLEKQKEILLNNSKLI